VVHLTLTVWVFYFADLQILGLLVFPTFLNLGEIINLKHQLVLLAKEGF